MNTGEIIKKLRLEKKLTQEQLGDLIGVQKSAIAKYENGRVENLKRSTIEKLAILFEISPSSLLGIGEEVSEITSIKFDDYFPLHYCSNLSAGSFDELLDAEPDSVVYVPIKFQTKRKRLLAFKVNGTSMNNIIEDGDVVVVEKNDSTVYEDGDVVVAFVDGLATVKRYYFKMDSVMLLPDSDDKSHLPITVTEEQALIIVGKVIWHMNSDRIAERY